MTIFKDKVLIEEPLGELCTIYQILKFPIVRNLEFFSSLVI